MRLSPCKKCAVEKHSLSVSRSFRQMTGISDRLADEQTDEADKGANWVAQECFSRSFHHELLYFCCASVSSLPAAGVKDLSVKQASAFSPTPCFSFLGPPRDSEVQSRLQSSFQLLMVAHSSHPADSKHSVGSCLSRGKKKNAF